MLEWTKQFLKTRCYRNRFDLQIDLPKTSPLNLSKNQDKLFVINIKPFNTKHQKVKWRIITNKSWLSSATNSLHNHKRERKWTVKHLNNNYDIAFFAFFSVYCFIHTGWPPPTGIDWHTCIHPRECNVLTAFGEYQPQSPNWKDTWLDCCKWINVLLIWCLLYMK